MQTFINFAASNGVLIDSIIHGKIVRCPTTDHPAKRNGAFLFNHDYGWCQNWATHAEPIFWKDESKRTEEQQAALERKIAKSREEYARNRDKNAQEAASKARWILGQCELAEHKYIQRKGFKEHPVNVWQKDDQQLLIVPMYHKNTICGCQIINEDGEKKFLTGQRTSLAYFKIGIDANIFLVEGFSKGLAAKDILASIGCQSTIYVTFSVGNATKMAKYLPTAYWLGDNDENCVGQNAAEASGLRWWIPNTVGFGIDDAYFAQGKLKTGMQIKKFLMQTTR